MNSAIVKMEHVDSELKYFQPRYGAAAQKIIGKREKKNNKGDFRVIVCRNLRLVPRSVK